MTLFKRYKRKPKLVFILTFFAGIFGLITFINHYVFKTHGLDLGLYSHVALQYSRGILATSEMIKFVDEPQWAIHFDLYLLFLSPLVAIFGSYTLLVVQWLAILFGGYGVYRYLKFSFPESPNLRYFGLLYFFIFYGVYSAIAFDYHSIVVAACLLPWFFLAFKQNQYWQSLILFSIMLVSQENMSLFLAFVALGWTIEHRKNKVQACILIGLFLLAIVYFLLVVQIVIPSFALTKTYPGFCFSILGRTPKEAILQLISHPLDALKILFTNHNQHPFGNYVKLETHFSLLVSGVIVLFLRPAYLLMLLPLYGQKFFHDNHIMWSIDAQYSIEFVPILAIGIFTIIGEWKSKSQNLASILILVCTLMITVRVFDRTIIFTSKSKLRIYQKEHYLREYSVQKVYDVLNTIPKNSKVCAHSPFVPHLIFQPKIYEFPFVKDANVILLSTKESAYPLSQIEFTHYLDSLKSSPNWKHSLYDNHLWLFKLNQTLK